MQKTISYTNVSLSNLLNNDMQQLLRFTRQFSNFFLLLKPKIFISCHRNSIPVFWGLLITINCREQIGRLQKKIFQILHSKRQNSLQILHSPLTMLTVSVSFAYQKTSSKVNSYNVKFQYTTKLDVPKSENAILKIPLQHYICFY